MTDKEKHEKKKAQRREYYHRNKERIALKKAENAKTPHGRELDRMRGERYRAKHPERVRELASKRREKRKDIDRELAVQKRVQLEASYVAQLLRLPTAEVPEDLIEVERIRLKVKRLVQELENDRTEKKCSTCKEYRPLLSFSRSPRAKDGHGYECLFCKRERKRRDALSKGLTYTARKMDEFGRMVKYTPEELKAARVAYYQANIETIRAKDRARNKQRK
jgi:hypothetical protein